jgi:hypothetical protein
MLSYRSSHFLPACRQTGTKSRKRITLCITSLKLWYNFYMKKIILPIALIIIQLATVFLAGFFISTGMPGAIFSPSGKVVFLVGITSMFIYPLLGVFGIILFIYQQKKKIRNWATVILLISSIWFAAWFPATFISFKIAGIINPITWSNYK